MGFSKLKLNEAAIRELVAREAGPVGQQVEKVTRQTANGARRNAPVDTGFLRSSVRSNVEMRGNSLVGRVTDEAPYALYVHQGTRYMRGRPFLLNALQAASPWPVRSL